MREILKVENIVNADFKLTAHFTMSDQKTYLVNFLISEEKFKFLYATCINLDQFGLDPKFTDNELIMLKQYIIDKLPRKI
ncbi:hypothetical protein SAMN05443246_1145 [Paenibacillus sp. GP183]|jgi:hypothetical protein|nr:hypothetical protein SAMN05443246_1145 [Paenibacillus sp. GP183]